MPLLPIIFVILCPNLNISYGEIRISAQHFQILSISPITVPSMYNTRKAFKENAFQPFLYFEGLVSKNSSVHFSF